MKQEPHKHTFVLKDKILLMNALKRSRSEIEIRNINTAKDILKQRICKCGLIETYDLERTILYEP